MTRLIYGFPFAIAPPLNRSRPGLKRFGTFFKFYGKWVLPIDRTGTIKTPVRDHSLFPIPEFRIFSKTMAELCDERAIAVLREAERLGTPLYVLYSGGIDSSCVLVSLLKHATPSQKKNITVLLSHESIAENPRLYQEHIKGKILTASSISFPSRIGDDCMIVSGEHSDMVMGNDKIGKLLAHYGAQAVHAPYDRTLLTELFAEGSFEGDRVMAEFTLDLFERIRDAAPIPIISNMDMLWWANFALKWQACFHFILLFTPTQNASRVTQAYLDERFISFYNTDEFQLWAMNNLDKRIKDTWKSYKWVLKDIIYDYTNDAEYRAHKTKKGSLLPLIGYAPPHRFIDEHMHFHTALPQEDFLQSENDFA